jgi:hypothetical protein
MSKIKDLKNDPENVLNMVDVLSLFAPKGKSKYVELLLKTIKKTKDLDLVSNEIKKWLKDEYGVDEKSVADLTPFQLFVLHRFVTNSFENSDLKKFIKFCEYNERGLILNNDVTKYESFEEIISEYEKVQEKIEEKELEKQIIKLHDEGEWLVIRPLTFQASLKYGADTKWCTAMKKEISHFNRYTKRGILIYCINRVTGKKVAQFYSLDSEHEFSFWNQEDTRIDSLESGLPVEILNLIFNEVTNNKKSNNNLLPEEYRKDDDVNLKNSIGIGMLEQPDQENNYRIEEEPVRDEGPTDMEYIETESLNEEMSESPIISPNISRPY